MQIDFHHTVTYVAARAAGFSHGEADIVAHAAQYVDDATVAGIIKFDNGATYARISSAHKMIDPLNFDNDENRQVWLPFHFLPGNGGKVAGQDPEGSFIDKLVCTPNSPIANDMIAAAILNQDTPYGLHRLGVAMHVYADTWSHQGFAGVQHKINDVDDVEDIGNSDALDGARGFLGHLIESAAPCLGHAQAGILPDLPFLSWQYKNGRGQKIFRDNTSFFCEAADNLCKAMQRFRRRDPAADVPGLASDDRKAVRDLLGSLRDVDCNHRHQQWLQQIQDGRFSFGRASLAYSESAWKAQALGAGEMQLGAAAGAAGGSTTAGSTGSCHYTPEFLKSNWKLFHDAVQLHRLTVLHDILPAYGVCSG